MSSLSTNTFWYDISRDVNEDLDSPNELEGQPETDYNGGGQITYQNLPPQQSQGNHIVPSQHGGVINASPSVLGNSLTGFGSFGGYSLLHGASANSRNKHKVALKRLGQTTRSTSGMTAGARYTKIDQLVFSQHIRRVP